VAKVTSRFCLFLRGFCPSPCAPCQFFCCGRGRSRIAREGAASRLRETLISELGLSRQPRGAIRRFEAAGCTRPTGRFRVIGMGGKISLAVWVKVCIFPVDMEKEHITYAADRFNSIIEEICRVLTKQARARFISEAMLLLIWNRIVGMARRFSAIAERVRTGKRLPARSGAASAPTVEVATVEVPTVEVAERPGVVDAEYRMPVVLPQHFRWLVNMVPETERFGAELCWLLQRLEMEQLIDVAPEVGRILRPLCRMLGVEPTVALRSPVRAMVQSAPVVVEAEAECPTSAADGMCARWREPGLFWRMEKAFWEVYGVVAGDSEKPA